MEPGKIVELQPWENLPAAQPRIECKLSQVLLRKVELAHKLGHKWAKYYIEASCVLERREGGQWFDLNDAICPSDGGLNEAVEYLELMGMLQRHPDHRNLVQVKPAPIEQAPSQPEASGSFERFTRQQIVAMWCMNAFGAEAATFLPQRGVRHLEESCETAQAAGVTRVMAHKLVDYVWSRPIGDLKQEIGGAGLTLLALAAAAGLSADERVLSKPLEHFAKRNAEKNAAGINATEPKPIDWFRELMMPDNPTTVAPFLKLLPVILPHISADEAAELRKASNVLQAHWPEFKVFPRRGSWAVSPWMGDGLCGSILSEGATPHEAVIGWYRHHVEVRDRRVQA